MSWSSLWPGAGAHERAALQFEDLASALDSGLTPVQVGADPSLGDHAAVDLLTRRGTRLDGSERRILAAAWSAGRLPQALRVRAEQRRRRANLHRQVLAGLRYPILLLVTATCSSLLLASVLHSVWLPVYILTGVTALALVGFLIASGLRHGTGPAMWIPPLRRLAQELGELPYLEVLQGLYASGVPLLTAHGEAVAACPVEVLREPLDAVDRIVQANQSLGEALASTGALCDETRTLLTQGERTGDLEGALARALTRRSEVVGRRTATLARLLGAAAYAFAVAVVVFLVFRFYSGLYAPLRGR